MVTSLKLLLRNICGVLIIKLLAYIMGYSPILKLLEENL